MNMFVYQSLTYSHADSQIYKLTNVFFVTYII